MSANSHAVTYVGVREAGYSSECIACACLLFSFFIIIFAFSSFVPFHSIRILTGPRESFEQTVGK